MSWVYEQENELEKELCGDFRDLGQFLLLRDSDGIMVKNTGLRVRETGFKFLL